VAKASANDKAFADRAAHSTVNRVIEQRIAREPQIFSL
jgi:hypothetical protein